MKTSKRCAPRWLTTASILGIVALLVPSAPAQIIAPVTTFDSLAAFLLRPASSQLPKADLEHAVLRLSEAYEGVTGTPLYDLHGSAFGGGGTAPCSCNSYTCGSEEHCGGCSQMGCQCDAILVFTCSCSCGGCQDSGSCQDHCGLLGCASHTQYTCPPTSCKGLLVADGISLPEPAPNELLGDFSPNSLHGLSVAEIEERLEARLLPPLSRVDPDARPNVVETVRYRFVQAAVVRILGSQPADVDEVARSGAATLAVYERWAGVRGFDLVDRVEEFLLRLST